MVAAIETTSNSRSRQRSLRPGLRDFRAASPRSFASEVYPDDLIYSCDIGMPLRLGGENRLSSIEPSAALPNYSKSRVPGSEFPRSHSGAARHRNLIIEHCSPVIERSAVAWQGKQGYQFEQPLGLQYVRQRWYDPATRQFPGAPGFRGLEEWDRCPRRATAAPLNFYARLLGFPDATGPWGFESGQVSGGDVNLFRYAGNNPVNRNDPSGMGGNALAEYLFYRHAAILLANDIRVREQASPIQHPGYIGLLYGIWRATYWEEETAYNRLYNRFAGGPWEVLRKVKEELEKIEKAVHAKKVMPLAKKITEDVEKELKTVNTLISTFQAGHGLSSDNQIAQLRGLGNALTALGNLVPEELGLGSIMKAYGSYLAGAAGAADRIYASYGSHSAYRFWVEQLNESSPSQQPGLAFPSNLSPTTPFTPAWALQLAQTHNYGLGSYAALFHRKYGWVKSHQKGGGD